MDLRRLGATLMVLAAGLVLLFLYVNSHKPNNAGQLSTAPTASQPAAASATPATAPAPAAAPKLAAAEPPVARAGGKEKAKETEAEKTDKWFGAQAERRSVTLGAMDDPNGYLFQVQLDSVGSAVSTAKLTNYFVTEQDERLFEKNPGGYEAAAAKDPAKYKGHYSVLNPLGPAGPSDAASQPGSEVLPLATRGLTVSVEGNAMVDLTLADLDQKPWELLESTADTARFAYVLYYGPNWDKARSHPILRLVKTYTLRKGDYTIYVSLAVENLCGLPLKVSLDQIGPTGLPLDNDPRGSMRRVVYGLYNGPDNKVKAVLQSEEIQEGGPGGLGGLFTGIGRAVGLMKAAAKPPARIEVGRSDQSPPSPLWVGTVNKYFGSMMYVLPSQKDKVVAPEWRAQFYFQATPESDKLRVYVPGVSFPELLLLPGQPAKEINFEVFAGPKKRELFSDKGAPHYQPIYEKLDYVGTIEFGACCSWGPLALGMMWLLGILSHVTFGNYGLALIVLVFLVRLALHPLTKKSQVSMMRMQKLAPQIQKLKDKYGEDKTALNKEMMQIYKHQGVAPLWGCLPMLLQLPIWGALYGALYASVELRHAGFLPVWLTDLSAPDTIAWPAKYGLPLVGHTLHLLPLLLTVAMFFQTKLTPTMTQATATPDQARQQKMMQYMMPGMMLLFFYSTPSGLTLYIMASTFAGVIEQVVIRRHIQAREAAAAAAETTVPLPGGTFRGQRPKKSRGPFWTKRG